MREQLEQLLRNDDYSKKLSDEWFNAQHKPMLHIYIDMATMFDYKLTALLGLCKKEVEHAYIKEQLPKYLTYKGKQITKCFPALQFKEEDILSFMQDENNNKIMSCGGIITNMSNLVPAQLFMAGWINQQSPNYRNEPIHLHFVNEYFKPFEPYMDKMIEEIKKSFPNIKHDVKHTKIVNEPEKYLTGMDILILDDMEEFTKEGNPTHEWFFTKKFIGSIFNVTFRLGEDDPFTTEDKKEEIKEKIKNTEALFNTFSTFNFVDKIIISHMPTEGDIHGATFNTSDS